MASQRFEELEMLRAEFGNDTKILDEIVDAMSSSDFHDIYEHICDMWNLNDDEKEEE